MAVYMPPWDWLDYAGADAIGGLIGLWLKFCVSIPKKVFVVLTNLVRTQSPGPWQRF